MHKGKGASRADWETPEWLLQLVREVIGGPIGLDPATTSSNPTRAISFYCPPVFDGLTMPWVASSVFLNPPWSRKQNLPLGPWLERAREMRLMGHASLEMFILVSAAMNARWFHDHLGDADAFFFSRGRVAYQRPEPGEEAGSPGFDSVLCYYGPQPGHFGSVFRQRGLVVYSSPWQ